MAHAPTFDSETAQDAVFRCTLCGTLIGFNKAETSEPHAVKTGADWQPPENPDQWMGPCTQ